MLFCKTVDSTATYGLVTQFWFWDLVDV